MGGRDTFCSLTHTHALLLNKSLPLSVFDATFSLFPQGASYVYVVFQFSKLPEHLSIQVALEHF